MNENKRVPTFQLGSMSPSDRAIRHRATGCVVGAAVGDALGAPFEFRPGGLYRERFPVAVHGGSGEMIGGGGFGWAPGEFTDDTQMALVLAASLLESGGYDPDHLWRGWRHWAGGAADVGLTTRQALGFADWRAVHHHDPERTGSNGALMRAFPLAVATVHVDDELAREVTVHQGAMTHAHPAASWGAWLAVAMMRAGIRGEDPFGALDVELDRLPESVRHGFVPLLHPDWHPVEAPHGNGSVWVCLAQAVWALRHHDSFESAVVAAVDLGDDADTVACVTGALAGAVHGVQAVPARWATYVHGRVATEDGERRFDNADLQAVAARLSGASPHPAQEPERAVGPVEVAPGLYAANLDGARRVAHDWAVVSLCRTDESFARRSLRRQVYLVDNEGDHNPRLDLAVRDAVDAVDAFLADGHQVVVHCHGGRSRTGLVLKAWKMRTDGVDHETANAWLTSRWPLLDTWNRDFTRFLDHSWP